MCAAALGGVLWQKRHLSTGGTAARQELRRQGRKMQVLEDTKRSKRGEEEGEKAENKVAAAGAGTAAADV